MSCSANTKQFQGKGSEDSFGEEMGRISHLKTSAITTLDADKTGSYASRKLKKQVVLKFVDALFTCTNVPPSWKALNEKHIHAVASLWNKQKLSSETIRKYLRNVSQFLQSIGLPAISMKKIPFIEKRSFSERKPYSEAAVNEITVPIIKCLIHLQTEYGLTLSEAFRFVPDWHIREEFLLLTRDMTTDSRDRVIPITTKNQKRLLEELETILDNNMSPLDWTLDKS